MQFIRSSIHLANHTAQELHLVAAAKHTVCHSTQYFPPQIEVLIRGYNAFFGQHNLAQSIHCFLNETSSRGELSWVKPIRDDVRVELVSLLKKAKPERRTRKNEQRILITLHEHLRKLSNVLGMWEPSAHVLVSKMPMREHHDEFIANYLIRAEKTA